MLAEWKIGRQTSGDVRKCISEAHQLSLEHKCSKTRWLLSASSALRTPARGECFGGALRRQLLHGARAANVARPRRRRRLLVRRLRRAHVRLRHFARLQCNWPLYPYPNYRRSRAMLQTGEELLLTSIINRDGKNGAQNLTIWWW